MIILGIDPGSRVTGYGVVHGRSGRLRRVGGGCIRTSGNNVAQRMKQIFNGLTGVIDEFRPHVVAVERVFVSVNARSALMLGHARGTAICACAAKDLEVFEYAAREVKKTIAANGSATKEQVQFMVRAMLSLKSSPSQDEADALACAITHYQHLPMLKAMEGELDVRRFRRISTAGISGAGL